MWSCASKLCQFPIFCLFFLNFQTHVLLLQLSFLNKWCAADSHILGYEERRDEFVQVINKCLSMPLTNSCTSSLNLENKHSHTYTLSNTWRWRSIATIQQLYPVTLQLHLSRNLIPLLRLALHVQQSCWPQHCFYQAGDPSFFLSLTL